MAVRDFTGGRIDNASVPDIQSTLTIAGWFRPESFASSPRIISRWSGNGTRPRFLMQLASSKLNWVILGSDAGGQSQAGATTLSLNTIYHCAGVFVPSTRLTVYLNGVQDGNLTSSVKSGLATGGPVEQYTLGADPSGSEPLNGQIANCAFWNAALTAAEILSLAKGRSPSLVRPLNLQHYAPLWGLAYPEPDLSGKLHNGTAGGTTPPAVAAIFPMGRYR